MMQSYWPTAGDQPRATKHDKQHSRWYNNVAKVILSRTMQAEKLTNTTIIGENLYNEIIKLKNLPGKDIIIFGSPTAAHSLMQENLIDDFWLFVNPVLLARGIPLFKGINDKIKLKLVFAKALQSGVVCMHYERTTGD